MMAWACACLAKAGVLTTVDVDVVSSVAAYGAQVFNLMVMLHDERRASP